MLEEHARRLSRPIHPMPDFVQNALTERNLIEEYHARPSYQQNDYVGWISRAKLNQTQQKRLQIMLDELAAGHGYMGLEYTKKSQ